MISQVGRSDPALIQYAMQSFGTINLTEEDWIKAEDHYKVIIIKLLHYFYPCGSNVSVCLFLFVLNSMLDKNKNKNLKT